MGTRGHPPPFGHRVAEVAARQHDVVDYPGLRAAGLSRKVIESAVRAGWLHVVHLGVYAVGSPLLTPEGRWMAATLTCGSQAVLSHGSAAALWTLEQERRPVPEVTVRTTGRRSPPGIAIHRSRNLPEGEVTEQRSIRVTTPARTLTDIATHLSHRGLERALDQVHWLKLVRPGELEEMAQAHRGHIGAARLARTLASHRPGSTLTASRLEELFLALCRRHGLPQPEVNVPVGRLTVDFLWRVEGLVVETDGYASHANPQAFERDHDRDLQLDALGYAVLRFTYRQVTTRPRFVVASVRRKLERLRRPPAPSRPGWRR